MSDVIVSAIISAIALIVIGVLTIFGNYKLALKLKTIHQQINSRMDQLLQIRGDKERAEGVLEGKAESESNKKDR